MIYNYELILQELEGNGVEILDNRVSLKYDKGYHRYEKRLFGHIRVKQFLEVRKIFNFFPIWISKRSVLNDVQKILAEKIGMPHARNGRMLFYWLPFNFNGNMPGVEIITVSE